MFKLRYILVGVLFLIIESNTLILGQTIADSKPLYRNPDSTVDVRVKDLITRMTQEEKVGQLKVMKLYSFTFATNSVRSYYP